MTIDFVQLAVAGAATCSYACTSLIAQRLVVRRRRRQIRNEARFTMKLAEGARAGTLHSLSDVNALYRECCSLDQAVVVAPHRLAHFIHRSSAKLRRRLLTRPADADAIRACLESSVDVLRYLQHECDTMMRQHLVRKAGVSEEDRDRVEGALEEHPGLFGEPMRRDAQARARRRESQRRVASYFWGGVTGAGCIAFVQLALVVWHVLH
jgi:hypothetical protein